jgi:hypothetical protein
MRGVERGTACSEKVKIYLNGFYRGQWRESNAALHAQKQWRWPNQAPRRAASNHVNTHKPNQNDRWPPGPPVGRAQ